MADFLKNFTKWKENQGENSSNTPPKQRKNRSDQLSGGVDPDQCADAESGGGVQSQVCPADPEAQIHPCHQRAQHKQDVRRSVSLPAQGAQKIVAQPQPRPQKKTVDELGCRLRRCRHPNNRLAQPPLRFGSS